MHSVLALEESVGIIPLDIDGHRLDAGLIAVEQLSDRGLVAVALGIAEIEPHQHLRPVLAFGAPGAGVDFKDHPEFVLLAAEHVAQFQFLKFLLHYGILRVDIALFHETLLEEVHGETQLLHLFFEDRVGVDPEMQTFDLAHLGFRLLAVIPEISHMGAEFLLLHLYLLGVDVEISLQLLAA